MMGYSHPRNLGRWLLEDFLSSGLIFVLHWREGSVGGECRGHTHDGRDTVAFEEDYIGRSL